MATGRKPEIGSEENRNAERLGASHLVKFCAFKVPPDPSPWGEEISQASRRISTARLNASLRFHPRPIEDVVYVPS